jgi:hypothetical protein
LSLRSSWFQLPDMSLNNAKTKNTIHTGEVISANGQAAHARNPLAREQESPQSSASLETEAGGSPVEAMITVQSLRSTVTDSPENDVEHDPSPRAALDSCPVAPCSQEPRLRPPQRSPRCNPIL